MTGCLRIPKESIFIGVNHFACYSVLDEDLRDRKNRRAMIIEAKKSESRERMEYWCQDALDQIVRQEYARDLEGYKKVLCYGVAFYRKSALVRKLKSRRISV